MWKFDNIVFKNLFSHSYSEFNFNQGEMTLILGVIEDNVGGSDSNGAGKSTIVEAVTLAITGEVYRDVLKEHFVRKGERSCVVILTMHNDVSIDGINKVIIERTFFKSSSSSKLRIYINEGESMVEKTDFPKIDDGNKFILNLLGVSKEDFLNYYVIGQGNNKSFFSAGDAKQKEIIGRFSNFNDINSLIASIDNKINDLNTIISEKEQTVEITTFNIEQLEESIKNFKENREQEKIQRVNKLKEDAENIQSYIDNCQNKINDNKSSINSLSKQITALKLKINGENGIQQELDSLDKSITELNEKIRALNKQYASLHNQLGKAVTCPHCNTEFIPECDTSLEVVKKKMKDADVNLLKLDKQLSELYERRKIKRDELDKISGFKNELKIWDKNIVNFKSLNDELEKDFKELKNKLKKTTDQLQDSSKLSTIDQDYLDDLKTKLRVQVSQRFETNESLKRDNKELEEMKFFKFHFSRSGFKTYLANKSIKSIQDICNYYLSKFKTDFQVAISGYKVLKSGEVRDKIDVGVIKDGTEKGVFQGYSGGEKSRIDLCGIITINKLINNTAPHGKGIDILMIDEIGDLDESGKLEIIKILSKSDITSVLILHEIKDVPYKNKVYVKYSQSESRIII